jgi:2-polyprenyl-3-methyl-5-hydroxy-6-metoxy-1,4-benzoquinol methylase
MTTLSARAAAEKAHYDEHGFIGENRRKLARFHHVFNSPNTRRGEALFRDLTLPRAAGQDVLELGCGGGSFSRTLTRAGASHVCALDISEAQIALARQKGTDDGRIDFRVHDAEQPVEGVFKLIVGRAVLHHVAYQSVMSRLYNDNLAPGGRMVFMEPLGVGLLSRLHWRLNTSVHTPDERPFVRDDLRWLQATFPGFTLYGINYLSYGLAAFTSLVLRSPDNVMLVAADRLDVALHDHFPALRARCRSGLLVVDRPAKS